MRFFERPAESATVLSWSTDLEKLVVAALRKELLPARGPLSNQNLRQANSEATVVSMEKCLRQQTVFLDQVHVVHSRS